MNSKKGKKARASKPVPTNPPQADNPPPEDDKVEEQSVEKLQSELKCDEKGPEVVSEVPPIDTKTDTPKKPKRNRGKKKKHDKDDDFTENQEEVIQEPVIPEPNVVDNIENVLDVTPIARKKKNKKKDKNNDAVQEEGPENVITEDRKTPDPPETKEQVLEQKEQTLQPRINIDEHEFQTPKKKNKKKKRQDSEKSEQTEEPVTCTAAFEKLLVPEESKDNKIVDDAVKVKEVVKTKLEEVVLDTDTAKQQKSTIKNQEQEIKEVTRNESKGKKNNKKDKNHPPKIDTDTVEQLKSLPLQDEIIAPSKPAEVIASPSKPDNVKELSDIQELPKAIPQEVSSKSNAKIAKPVDKKRKGKEEVIKTEESQTDEVKPQSGSADIMKDVPKTLALEPEVKQKHIVEKDIDTADHVPTSTDIKKGNKQMKGKSGNTGAKQLKTHVLNTPLIEPVFEGVTDYKAKLEDKKDTTPVQTSAGVPVPTAYIATDSKISDEDKTKEQSNLENVGNLDSPVSESIEISSVKTDEEGLACEAIPDIHHPRASSQQLVDDNNNMVIQEITTGNLRLDLPIFSNAPFIQGSGETPMNTPEIFTPGITLKEVNTSPEVREEKTDLKSKMMEVNQDMEDLRMSIEKSLAELTAMEKTEEVEKEELKATTEEKKSDSVPQQEKEDSLKTKEEPTNIKGIVLTKESSTKATQVENPPEAPVPETPPVCPSRKDQKGKGKQKKKGKHDSAQTVSSTATTAVSSTTSDTQSTSTTSAADKGTQQEAKKEEKSDKKSETTKEKGNQQSDKVEQDNDTTSNAEFEPIDNFEDALTSSVDDVNKTFEIIVNENDQAATTVQAWTNPEINVIAPEDSSTKPKNTKTNPVSQPKNLLGHTDIPVSSNKTDYKKEKDKTPNTKQAKVRIRDSIEVERKKQSQESQTENRRKHVKDTFSQIVNHNDEYVYKYSFRKVFLQSSCHVCKKDLGDNRVPCNYCSLVFYCSDKHKGEDWPDHQALCFAVSTIVHLKNQKHIYSDAIEATGYDYRVIRMQMILSCEKVMKRRLAACEQEMLLYPRLCAAPSCREWRQGKLKDCPRCGQVSYCCEEHLPTSHSRWCSSYDLYRKLVTHQQTLGRLEPKLPTRVITGKYDLPEKMNEVLAAIYEEKIDMNDIQYAALTQVATGPLTTAFCHKTFKKSSMVIHVVNAELQFEADALNKWETFFLHLRPEVRDLTVVLIGTDLNPSSLPLELLGKIKLCTSCRQANRRLVFNFQDQKTYLDYRRSEDFVYPDLVCTFNASIHRASSSNINDTWPGAIESILELKRPFLVTSHSMLEAQRDLRRVIEVARRPYEVLTEPKYNPFASVRPDRNFISDHEIPLLFKNYCYMVVCGV